MTFVASPISASAGHHGHSSPRGDGADNLVAGTLREHPRPGSNSAGALTAYTVQTNDGGSHKRADRPEGGMYVKETETALTLGSSDQTLLAPSAPVTAKWAKGSGGPAGDEVQNMVALNGVRRLTPRECERLQGWSDDHTRYAADGTEISDSHRYRLIGNGVASPVVEWIGRRLVAVDALL